MLYSTPNKFPPMKKLLFLLFLFQPLASADIKINGVCLKEWNGVQVTQWNGDVSCDVTSPFPLSAEINKFGDRLIIFWNEPVNDSGLDSSNLTLTGTVATVLNLDSGNGTTTLVYVLDNGPILSTETVTLDSKSLGVFITDLVGNPAADLSNFPVTNNSIQ